MLLPWETLLPAKEFYGIFLMTDIMFRLVEAYAIARSPILVKILGILFRQQGKYLYRPLIASRTHHMGTSSDLVIACWSWSVWLQLSDLGTKMTHMSEQSIYRVVFVPQCWSCSCPTTRICQGCAAFMTNNDMQPVPVCNHCVLCHHCRQDVRHGTIPSSIEDRLQFSYRFRITPLPVSDI